MSEKLKDMLNNLTLVLATIERTEGKVDQLIEYFLKKKDTGIGVKEKPIATTEKPLVEEKVDNATLFVKEVEDYSTKSLKLTSQSGQSAYMAKSMVESWDTDKITILKGKEWVLKKIEWK